MERDNVDKIYSMVRLDLISDVLDLVTDDFDQEGGHIKSANT